MRQWLMQSIKIPMQFQYTIHLLFSRCNKVQLKGSRKVIGNSRKKPSTEYAFEKFKLHNLLKDNSIETALRQKLHHLKGVDVINCLGTECMISIME